MNPEKKPRYYCKLKRHIVTIDVSHLTFSSVTVYIMKRYEIEVGVQSSVHHVLIHCQLYFMKSS